MRSDVHGIGIQLLKPSDIYSWIVIFGHKRPKAPIFPSPEYVYVKQTSMRGIRCFPSKLIIRLGSPWTCDFLYCASCLFVGLFVCLC